MSQKIRDYAIALSSVTVALAVLLLVVTLRREAAKVSGELQQTLVVARKPAQELSETLSLYREASEGNKRSLEASVQLGAVLNGTARLINRQVVPRVMDELDALAATTRSLDELIRNTDHQINAGLLPEITATARRLNVSIEAVDKAVADLAARGTLALDDIHAIMASPEWQRALANVERATASSADAAAQVAEASRQAPSIAASLEKIARTSSKYAKATLLANLVAVLARAFIP